MLQNSTIFSNTNKSSFYYHKDCGLSNSFFFKNSDFFVNYNFLNFFEKKTFSNINLFLNINFVFAILSFMLLFFILKNSYIFNKLKGVFSYKFLNIQDSFIFFYFLNFFFVVFLFNFFWKLKTSFFLVFILFILKTVILTPVFYIFNFKTSFFSCVNSTKKDKKTELIWSDFISVVSFFLRFFVQIIRIFLIIVVNSLLLEYVEAFSSNSLNLFKSNIFFFKESLFDSALLLLRFFLECLDFFFILIIQFCAYTLVLFWLLSFLLLTTADSIFEK